MTPFVAKAGETIKGLGFDFSTRLSSGETIASSAVVAGTGLTINSTTNSGTQALADVSIAAGLADCDIDIEFTVTGSAGSVRKASRVVWVRAASE